MWLVIMVLKAKQIFRFPISFIKYIAHVERNVNNYSSEHNSHHMATYMAIKYASPGWSMAQIIVYTNRTIIECGA